MLFRRLSQPVSGSLLQTVEGYLVSVALHTALIATAIVAGQTADAPQELPDSLEWARFLVPKDKQAGSAPVREHLTFFNAAAPGGSGMLVSDTREPERIELEVPEGTGADEQTDVAAAPPPAEEIKADEVLTVLEVDTAAARYDDSAAPPYPASMLAKKIEGSVAVQYVVDTAGLADTTSFLVLETTHADFAKSVKATLPSMRFRAAKMNGNKVRQLVQQLFSFRIDTTLLTKDPKKP